MHKNRFFGILAAALVSAMLLAACRSPVDSGEQADPQATEYGTVRITFGDGSARTIYPNKAFDAYVYTFTLEGGAAQVLTPVDGAFTLEAGNWNVRVDAYVGAVSPENKAASGEANFTLDASENKVVSITLTANETTGAGTFSWHILYPAGTTVETFTLRKLPGLTDVALNPQAGERTMTGAVADVPAGAYMLDIRLVNDGLYAGANEVVYIYALLTTEYGSLANPVVFEGQDFLGVFTDLDDVAQYLDEHTGGNSAANSILLPLAYDLGYMPDYGSGWRNLLDVIATAGKYVALDLSACTMDGTDFNPGYSVATGKDKIVSIDLPDVAASIAAGSVSGGSFNYFSSLTAVTAKYVLTVGNQAFYDPANHPNNNPSAVSSLTTVSLPSATNIGYAAFSYCNGLTTVSFSASADISYNPFNGCLNLTTFKLFGTGPLSVIEDGKAVVKNNTELMTYPSASGNITINTITSIGENAFSRCANLTGVSFPAVTSVAFQAFQNCDNLESISFPVMASADISSWGFGRSKLKNVSFATATSIGEDAFYNCTNLESVFIPEATTIGDYAFMNCTSLENVSFPAVTSIGVQAFYDCTSLESVSFPAVTSIGMSALRECTSLESVSFPEVTSIGNYVFAYSNSLTSVSFPASADIVENPFIGCGNLTTFTLFGTGSLSVIEDGKALVRNNTEMVAYPSASGTIAMNAITSIGNNTFIGCSSLESVSFPAATSIGEYAFLNCSSLINVSIPAAISIGNRAFARGNGDTALTVITLGATPPTLGTEIFYGVDNAKNVTVRFPFIGAAAYGNAPAGTAAQNWGNAFRGMGWDGTAYQDGAVNENINLTYVLIGGLTGEEGAVTFVYYWVNEQDVIATAGGASGNAFILPFGNSLTITANGNGYTNQRWYIDGVEDSGQAGSTAYVFSSAGKTPKRYTVGLIVEKGGRYYNVNFAVTVG